MKRTFFLAAALAVSFCAHAISDTLTATQRIYVDSLLVDNPNLYILNESAFDTLNLSFVKEEYHSSPYYISADFNRDGAKDFAVLFGDKNKHNERCLVIFNGVKSSEKFVVASIKADTKTITSLTEENINNSLFIAFRKNLHLLAAETCVCSEFIWSKSFYIFKPCK